MLESGDMSGHPQCWEDNWIYNSGVFLAAR